MSNLLLSLSKASFIWYPLLCWNKWVPICFSTLFIFFKISIPILHSLPVISFQASRDTAHLVVHYMAVPCLWPLLLLPVIFWEEWEDPKCTQHSRYEQILDSSIQASYYFALSPFLMMPAHSSLNFCHYLMSNWFFQRIINSYLKILFVCNNYYFWVNHSTYVPPFPSALFNIILTLQFISLDFTAQYTRSLTP